MSAEIQTPQSENLRPSAPSELVDFVRSHFRSKTCRVIDCGCDLGADLVRHDDHLDLRLPNSDGEEMIELACVYEITGNHLMLSSCQPENGSYADDFCIRQIAIGLNGNRPPIVYALGNYRELDDAIIEIGPLE